jgi:hypothetical protein
MVEAYRQVNPVLQEIVLCPVFLIFYQRPKRAGNDIFSDLSEKTKTLKVFETFRTSMWPLPCL